MSETPTRLARDTYQSPSITVFHGSTLSGDSGKEARAFLPLWVADRSGVSR